MKIAIVNNLWSRGGVEIIIKKVAAALSLNHEVFFVVIGDKNEVVEIEGFKIYKIKPINIFGFADLAKHNLISRLVWHFFNLFNWPAARALENILKQEKPNLVWSNNLLGLGFACPKICAKLGIKNVQTVHDLAFLHPFGSINYGGEGIINTPWAKLYQFFVRRQLAKPTAVVFPSHWIAKLFQEKNFFTGSNLRVLANPINNFNLPVRDNIKSDQWLFVGQVEGYKGILWLTQVLRQTNFNFKLKIAGTGSKVEELKNIIVADWRFEYLGALPHAEILKLYQESAFTFAPSFAYESFHLVTQESLQNGTPVIGSNCGGIAEQVVDGQNGFLFEPGNSEALFKAIKAAQAASWSELSAQAKQTKILSLTEYISHLLA